LVLVTGSPEGNPIRPQAFRGGGLVANDLTHHPLTNQVMKSSVGLGWRRRRRTHPGHPGRDSAIARPLKSERAPSSSD
jgi:hypothetical protein